MSHGDKSYAGILDFALQDFAELDSELLFDAIDASALHTVLDNLYVALNHALRDAPLGFFKR